MGRLKIRLRISDIKQYLRECSSPQLEDLQEFIDGLLHERGWGS